METITIGEGRLEIEDLIGICRGRNRIRISQRSMERSARSRSLVEKWLADEKPVYGLTTGFGALSDVSVPKSDARKLQENILMSHAAGVGPPLDEEIVRGVMAIRIADLALGHSGIRPQTLETLADLINHNVCPVVPEKGSVGASGDLAPMAHLALVLIGQGEAFFDGRRMPGDKALEAAGLKPVVLEAGEGLALINGTQVMTAITALAVHDAGNLAKTADIACALSLEVLMGTNTEFDPRIHALRPHPGQTAAARNMARMVENSAIISSHKGCHRIQDAYTLRCSPQIHGASKDAISYVRQVVETEVNSSTTNPLIFPDGEDFILGGNFHGQPVALAADFLCMALAELANVSERRIERLVNPQLSGLPAFLVEKSGLNSGFMIPQYTAAALVSENKTLSHPACVDSIPTSANKEDHVSMGTISARKARAVLENTRHVLAIELLCGCQGLDLLTVGDPGPGTAAAYQALRKHVPRLDNDRPMHTDILTAAKLIKNRTILKAVQSQIGQME